MTLEEPPYVIALEGASNVRDLGGYPVGEGRRVRRGLVFRSAALNQLTERDQAILLGLGIRTVCDLRGRQESARAPTRLSGVTVVPLAIEPSVGAGLRDILHTKEATGQALSAVLRQAYASFALACTMQYRGLIDRVLDGGTPLLFHCSAGKDRTGFGAALLLTALGVPWEQVLADFEATNQLWRRDTVFVSDLPLTVRESLLRADPAMLTAAFEAARQEYGSVEQYLEAAIGLDSKRRARLRALLLME